MLNIPKSNKINLFLKRKQEIHDIRGEKLKAELEEKALSEANLIIEKERLAEQVEEQGGLWSNESQIDAFLEKLKSDKQKRQALKCQLDFRKKVLGVKCEKSLFYLSSNNKNKSVQEIKNNLLKVIFWKIPEIAEKITQSFDTPIILSEGLIQKEKEKNLLEANQTTEKLSGSKSLKR